MGNFKEDIARVKALVFDVDGVFTDGKITVTPDNQFVRSYNAKDGFGMKVLTSRGYRVAIITGGRGSSLLERFRMLGVEDVYTDCFEKGKALEDFVARKGLKYEEILYMGDDIPDIEPMSRVGVPVCPADAAVDVIRAARYVSACKGGEGCVRDIIEQVMRSQGTWFAEGYHTTLTSA